MKGMKFLMVVFAAIVLCSCVSTKVIEEKCDVSDVASHTWSQDGVVSVLTLKFKGDHITEMQICNSDFGDYIGDTSSDYVKIKNCVDSAYFNGMWTVHVGKSFGNLTKEKALADATDYFRHYSRVR